MNPTYTGDLVFGRMPTALYLGQPDYHYEYDESKWRVLKDMHEPLVDLVISRAGASSISELCLLGKPAILVPSPNVAEDHQTHNAMALVNKNAAVLVKDSDAQNNLIATALRLIKDDQQLLNLHTNILTLALPDSARIIAAEVIKLAQKQE